MHKMMIMPAGPALTQRAYTVRLRPDDAQISALWATHVVVNRGARWFGDWLLTLRAGLTPAVIAGASDEAERRVLLALCWLTVEDAVGAPAEDIVCRAADPPAQRERALTERLERTLQHHGIAEPQRSAWLAACSSTFRAAIREDAVWVDRAQAFARQQWPAEEARRIVEQLLGDPAKFLKPTEPDEEAGNDDATPASNKARGWLSKHWGSGQRSDRSRIADVLQQIIAASGKVPWNRPGSAVLQDILERIRAPGSPGQPADERVADMVGWRGRPSKARVELRRIQDLPQATSDDRDRLCRKLMADAQAAVPAACDIAMAIRSRLEQDIGMPYRTERDMIGEYSTMLDQAIRRVMSHFSWVRRADARRRAFERDADRIERVDPLARAFLDAYIERRSLASGAGEEGYRLRRSAADGWERVHRAWQSCADRDARIEAAREQQALAAEADEKFGDIQLFEALADEAAAPIREAPPALLIDYIAATVARRDQQRFKVPAYRHPDPLRHPVFVEFGNSRWHIRYDVQARGSESTRRRAAINGEAESPAAPSIHFVEAGLWDGNAIQRLCIRWQGDRLLKDLGLIGRAAPADASSVIVPRADRLGLAACNAQTAKPSMPFLAAEDWNGRLQAPREELRRLASLLDAAKPASDAIQDPHEELRRLASLPGTAAPSSQVDKRLEAARQAWRKLRWYFTVSVECQPQGPWQRYVHDHPELGLPADSRKGIFADNTKRGKLARLRLCRLPGLRVLSIDLGLRYAAAAAVWQVCNAQELFDTARQLGLEPPSAEAHWWCCQQDGHRVWYRRIADDVLNGQPHPGSWARLERQFLIKVPGEELAPRKASPAERDLLAKLMSAMHRQDLDAAQALQRAGLTQSADAVEVRTVLLRELRRWQRWQRRRAMIAWAMGGSHGRRQRPGGKTEEVPCEEAEEHLIKQLDELRELALQDPISEQFWKQLLEPLGAPGVAEAATTDRQFPDAASAQQARLRPVARALLAIGRRQPLLSTLDQAWRQDEGRIREFLQRIRDLLVPPSGAKFRQLRGTAARHVGGLSLDRIALLTELYRAMRSQLMSPTPDGGPRTAQAEDPDHPFARRILAVRDRLREQRVRVIASRIVEAALGLGIAQPHQIIMQDGRRRGIRWARRLTVSPGGRHAAVHAVVIEQLEHYRPDERRFRRENRALMTWSARTLHKFLDDACFLYGLRMVEISPAYTSRSDSRRGGFGLRCREYALADWLQDPYWQKLVHADPTRQPSDEQRFAQQLDQLIKHSLSRDARLIVPWRGGDLFVPADPDGGPIQADLNAAANIGWKALKDPDWQGGWLYVPCERQSGRVRQDDVHGTPSEWWRQPLLARTDETAPPTRASRRSRRQHDDGIVNAWRTADGSWSDTKTHWREVKRRVLEHLLAINRRRLGLS